MNDICFFSGLPYCCNMCPEDDAPCDYKISLKSQDKINQLAVADEKDYTEVY